MTNNSGVYNTALRSIISTLVKKAKQDAEFLSLFESFNSYENFANNLRNFEINFHSNFIKCIPLENLYAHVLYIEEDAQLVEEKLSNIFLMALKEILRKINSQYENDAIDFFEFFTYSVFNWGDRKFSRLSEFFTNAFSKEFVSVAPQHWILYPFLSYDAFPEVLTHLYHKVLIQDFSYFFRIANTFPNKVLTEVVEFCISNNSIDKKLFNIYFDKYKSFNYNYPILPVLFNTVLKTKKVFDSEQAFFDVVRSLKIKDFLSSLTKDLGAFESSFLEAPFILDKSVQIRNFNFTISQNKEKIIKESLLESTFVEYFHFVLHSIQNERQYNYSLVKCINYFIDHISLDNLFNVLSVVDVKNKNIYDIKPDGDFYILDNDVYVSQMHIFNYLQRHHFPLQVLASPLAAAFVPSVPVPEQTDERNKYYKKVIEAFPLLISFRRTHILTNFFYAFFNDKVDNTIFRRIVEKTCDKIIKDLEKSYLYGEQISISLSRKQLLTVLGETFYEFFSSNRTASLQEEHENTVENLIGSVLVDNSILVNKDTFSLIFSSILLKNPLYFKNINSIDEIKAFINSFWLSSYKHIIGDQALSLSLVKLFHEKVFPLAEKRRLENLASNIISSINFSFNAVPQYAINSLAKSISGNDPSSSHIDFDLFSIYLANALQKYFFFSETQEIKDELEKLFNFLLDMSKKFTGFAFQSGISAPMVAGKYWKVYYEYFSKRAALPHFSNVQITSPKAFCDVFPLFSFFSIEIQACFAALCGMYATKDPYEMYPYIPNFLDIKSIIDDAYLMKEVLAIPGAEVSLRQVVQVVNRENTLRYNFYMNKSVSYYETVKPFIVSYLKYIANGRLVPGYVLPEGFFFVDESIYPYLLDVSIRKNACILGVLKSLSLIKDPVYLKRLSASDVLVALVSNKNKSLIGISVDNVLRPTQAVCPFESWCTNLNNEHDAEAYKIFSVPQRIQVDYRDMNNTMVGYFYFRKRFLKGRRLLERDR